MALLSWLIFVTTVSAAVGHFKFYRMEKVERVEVKEFEMGDGKPDKHYIQKTHNNEQRGNFTDCGKGSTEFSVQWTPLVLKNQGDVTLIFDMVAPVKLQSGKANISVVLPPDTPIVSGTFPLDCTVLEKFVTKCPIEANAKIQGKYTYSDLQQLPTGKYILTVNVTNESDKLFLCGRAKITVA